MKLEAYPNSYHPLMSSWSLILILDPDPRSWSLILILDPDHRSWSSILILDPDPDPRTDASDHIFVLGIFILLLLLVVCSHCWGRKASMLGPQGLTRATRPNYLQHFFGRKCWFWDNFFGHSRGNSWHFLVIYCCPWYILGVQCFGEVQTWIFPAIKESESC